MIATNRCKTHKFIIAIKLICTKTSFTLNHALIYRRHIGQTVIGFGCFNHVGALHNNRTVTMPNNIATIIQNIGHSIIAHSQIYYNIRQKVSADTGINQTVKAPLFNNRHLQNKNHLGTVIHYIRNIRLHGFFTILKIIFISITVPCGGITISVHFTNVNKAIARCNIITNRHQFRRSWV